MHQQAVYKIPSSLDLRSLGGSAILFNLCSHHCCLTMQVRNHVVWFVMHTYQVLSWTRWAPPRHDRAWVVVLTGLRHIPVLHRGGEPLEEGCRSKHIFLSDLRSRGGFWNRDMSKNFLPPGCPCVCSSDDVRSREALLSAPLQ